MGVTLLKANKIIKYVSMIQKQNNFKSQFKPKVKYTV